MAASKAVAISNTQAAVAATLGMTDVQPFLFAFIASNAPLIGRTFDLHSPTLLSLACALTI